MNVVRQGKFRGYYFLFFFPWTKEGGNNNGEWYRRKAREKGAQWRIKDSHQSRMSLRGNTLARRGYTSFWDLDISPGWICLWVMSFLLWERLGVVSDFSPFSKHAFSTSCHFSPTLCASGCQICSLSLMYSVDSFSSMSWFHSKPLRLAIRRSCLLRQAFAVLFRKCSLWIWLHPCPRDRAFSNMASSWDDQFDAWLETTGSGRECFRSGSEEFVLSAGTTFSDEKFISTAKEVFWNFDTRSGDCGKDMSRGPPWVKPFVISAKSQSWLLWVREGEPSCDGEEKSRMGPSTWCSTVFGNGTICFLASDDSYLVAE